MCVLNIHYNKWSKHKEIFHMDSTHLLGSQILKVWHMFSHLGWKFYLSLIIMFTWLFIAQNVSSHIKKGNKWTCSNHLVPISQWVPLQPLAHWQLYWSNPSMHVPPFWHGLLAQVLTTAWRQPCGTNCFTSSNNWYILLNLACVLWN